MVSDIYMAKDHSDNETANPLCPLCVLLCPLSYIPQIAQNTSLPFCMAGIRNGLMSPPRGMDPMTIHTSSRHSIIEFTACVYILLSLIKYTQLIQSCDYDKVVCLTKYQNNFIDTKQPPLKM